MNGRLGIAGWRPKKKTQPEQRGDRTILLETKPIFDPADRLNWSSDLPMGQWDGVTVRDGRVVALTFNDVAEKEDFEEHGVEGALQRLLLRGGSIPPEWGQLDGLQVLCIAGTGLEGRIPPEIGDCEALTGLQITENGIDPRITAELGRCSLLRVLHLDCLEGPAQGGTIPPELGNCGCLEHLNLSAMSLSGEIPAELANCTHLKTLVLRENDLSGGIPDALGDLRDIEELDLSGNDLTGPLPASIGGDRPLRKLWLGHNQLTGNAPEAFGACYALNTLAIADSGLSGALPDELGRRAHPEDSRAADQGPLLAQMSTSEHLAYMAAEWADNTVAPLLVDLGTMEPRFPVGMERTDRWPPAATRESPAAVYVDDERTLEATRALQSEGSSLGM